MAGNFMGKSQLAKKKKKEFFMKLYNENLNKDF